MNAAFLPLVNRIFYTILRLWQKARMGNEWIKTGGSASPSSGSGL
jgi:hypothetical protein